MKTICIDIDGTICQYTEWVVASHFGKVLPGAKEAIEKLHNEGWYIIIFSTRADKNVISNFLRENEIYFDSINLNPFQPKNAIGGKPLADVYLDDRAITFNGNWAQAFDQIVSFKPWEEK